LAIIRSGADPAAAVQLARIEVERELAPQPNQVGVISPHMSAPDIGILASILDHETRNRFAATMLERALDRDRDELSRWHDLAGLSNISNDIDQAIKSQLLPGVMELASGQHVGDQLISFDIDIGLTTIALQTAARLDPDPPRAERLNELVWRICLPQRKTCSGKSRRRLPSCHQRSPILISVIRSTSDCSHSSAGGHSVGEGPFRTPI
jgi:hypothetical protein